jgi:predicted GNAT family acetyltransferase
VLRSSLRLLDRDDRDEALALCARDPVSNTFVASRLLAQGIDARAGGELWGYYDAGRLTSVCWSGANLAPVEATPSAVDAFATRARRTGRHCSSIVGPAEAVLPLWQRLEPHWGRPREVRAVQPLMAITTPPQVDPDPGVRLVRPSELDAVLPACIAMFTEEVGYSPVLGDGGAVYRTQVAALVASSRSFARFDATSTDVVFKAELGSVTPQVAQVQGVWVHPRFRGRGLAAPGMAAVVLATRRLIAPVVSLYVNDYNVRAIRTYERVGFERVGTYATVLF